MFQFKRIAQLLRSNTTAQNQNHLFNFSLGVNSKGISQSYSKPTGKIDPHNTSEIRSVLKQSEKYIRGRDKEHAITITKSGEIYHTTGSAGRVDVQLDVPDEARKGAIVTHNHPELETGGSFSEDDLYSFYDNDFKILRGIDYKYTYGLKRKLAEPLADPKNILLDYKEAYREVGNQILQDKAPAQDLMHLVNKKLAKKYGHLYWRL